MTAKKASTRRSFLKSSALLAVPLAAGAPAAIAADGGMHARLAKLEDEAAIGELHQNWLRRINSGAADAVAPQVLGSDAAASGESLCSMAADHTAPRDALEIAADGQSAVGQYRCIVEVETPIARDCTLAQMAHAQGNGFVRRTERRVVRVHYVKETRAWRIAASEFAPA